MATRGKVYVDPVGTIVREPARARIPLGTVDLLDCEFFNKTPKSVLFHVVKHLAARLVAAGYEASIDTKSYLRAIIEEWQTLHEQGFVRQKPLLAFLAKLPTETDEHGSTERHQDTPSAD
jgi:hypothetical protein